MPGKLKKCYLINNVLFKYWVGQKKFIFRALSFVLLSNYSVKLA